MDDENPSENINQLLIAKNVGEPTVVRIEIFDDEAGFITKKVILPMLIDRGYGCCPKLVPWKKHYHITLL